MSLPSNIKQLLRSSGRNNNISIAELEAIISEILAIGGGSANQVEYDATGETGGNLVADKTDLQAAVKEVRDWLNEPSQSLGTFNPAMTFDGSGEYSDYTPASSSTVTFTATGIKSGNTQWVKIITDGTVTFVAGSGCELLSGSLGLLQAGTYKFGFGSIFGVVQIIVPGTEQSTQLSTPVLTASSQDAAIRIVFSSEDLASTGRELLRSTVNDVQTASSVAGFDGTADYIDDNNGAGLTNGTTYYYWGRNTAPGYTNSAYATDSAAPSASVTQLTTPTNLVATGGNNTVALAYDAIDANADDVAVQRSLTSGSGFATIATISRALTSYDDNTAVNGTTYYYRLIANGSGSYSNSNASAEAIAIPSLIELLTSLISYWELNETLGNRSDSHGTNTLTAVNSPSFGTGIIGNAVKIEVAEASFLLGNTDGGLAFGDEDFSICGWIYLDDKTTLSTILSKWDATNSDRSYALTYNNSTDRFMFYVSSDGTTTTSVTDTNIGSPSTATWYFVAAYHDSVNNEIGISLNGGEFDTTAHTTGVNENIDDEFVLGVFGYINETSATGSKFNGRLDLVGVWNKVLTLAEVQSLYNSGSGKAYASL